MVDWMARLPEELREAPLCQLCIPGSHDSGAYYFNMNMGFAHDQYFLKYIRTFDCQFVKRTVKRWGITQKENIKSQLELGVRYFDIRCELALDRRLASIESNRVDENTLEKRLFIVHGLYAADWASIAAQFVTFLDKNRSEVLIINCSHIYNMNDIEFRQFFVQAILNAAEHYEIELCPTSVNLRHVTLNQLLKHKNRIILIGPYESDVDGICFPSPILQNKWPRKNNVSDLLSWMQAQIHTPVWPGFHVMQGVITPKMTDIIRHIGSSLENVFSIPCRTALKQWIRNLSQEEIGNLNILILDQIDGDIVRQIFNLNVAHIPGYFLHNSVQIRELSPENPTPPKSKENVRMELGMETLEYQKEPTYDYEPEILIEEIFDESPTVAPKKPKRASVMVQQIEMVLPDEFSKDKESSSDGTSILTLSPIPPPKPKRFSQRIPIFMEVEPIPDDAVSIAPSTSVPLCRSTDTPVRIALPVTEEELRLAALGEYATFGTLQWKEEMKKREEEIKAKKEAEKVRRKEERKKQDILNSNIITSFEEVDEATPLISKDVPIMVESLVNRSTREAMDNLADHYKDLNG
uniref:Phosphatidylinositol-specific phospholipase C X domain-containing protein n=1 Tax=Caenorhabditis japonica TaxID=281687 RepID=A0A8R1I226_CAEJA